MILCKPYLKSDTSRLVNMKPSMLLFGSMLKHSYAGLALETVSMGGEGQYGGKFKS